MGTMGSMAPPPREDLFCAAVADLEVEVKAVGVPFMDPKLMVYQKTEPGVEDHQGVNDLERIGRLLSARPLPTQRVRSMSWVLPRLVQGGIGRGEGD